MADDPQRSQFIRCPLPNFPSASPDTLRNFYQSGAGQFRVFTPPATVTGNAGATGAQGASGAATSATYGPTSPRTTGIIKDFTLRRGTVPLTTASLAPAARETGLVSLSSTFSLLEVEVSGPCRVRLYSSAAFRDADLARGLTAPVSGAEHGVIYDLVIDTDATTTAGSAISGTYSYGSVLFADPDHLYAAGDGTNRNQIGTVTLADDSFAETVNTAMGFGGGLVFSSAQPRQVGGQYLYLLDNSLFLYEIDRASMIWTGNYFGNGSTSSVNHNWASNRGSVIFTHSNGHRYFVGHAPTQGLVVCIDVSTGVVAGGVVGYAFFNPSNVRDSTYGDGWCAVDGDTVWAVNYNATSKKISAISFNPAGSVSLNGGSPNYKKFDFVNRYTVRDYSALGYTAQCARFAIDPGHALILGTDLGGTTDHDQAKLIRWDYNSQTVTHESVKNFYGAWPADDGFSAAAASNDGYLYVLQYNGAPFAPDLSSQVLMKVSLTDLSVITTADLTSYYNDLRQNTIVDFANISTIAIDHPGGTYGSSARVTITASNNFVGGQSVTFSGLTTETWLNGLTKTVWAFAGLSSTQFTLKTTATDASLHSETGKATDAAAGPVAYHATNGELYLDWITSAKASSPLYAVKATSNYPILWVCSPEAIGSDVNGAGSIAYTVDNLDTVDAAVKVTFTVLREEK